MMSVAGAPAPAFGNGGLSITASVTKPPVAVAVAPGGKIVSLTGPESVLGGPLQRELLRFNPNGSLDTSFGDHGAVARWRRDESLRRTAARRPDLLALADLTDRDRQALD